MKNNCGGKIGPTSGSPRSIEALSATGPTQQTPRGTALSATKPTLKQFEITRTRDGQSYGEFCDETAEGALEQLISALKAEGRDKEIAQDILLGGYNVEEIP